MLIGWEGYVPLSQWKLDLLFRCVLSESFRYLLLSTYQIRQILVWIMLFLVLFLWGGSCSSIYLVRMELNCTMLSVHSTSSFQHHEYKIMGDLSLWLVENLICLQPYLSANSRLKSVLRWVSACWSYLISLLQGQHFHLIYYIIYWLEYNKLDTMKCKRILKIKCKTHLFHVMISLVIYISIKWLTNLMI